MQMSKGKKDFMPRKFFFVGPSGSGKTTLAGYFPDPYFLDFEQGVESIPHPVKFDLILEWNKLFDTFSKLEKIDAKTIVINDLTTMSITLIREVAKAAGRKVPQLQDRGVASEQMRSMLYQMFLPEFYAYNLVFISQVELQKDDLIGSITYQPSMPGKMGYELPPFCDEVYRFYTQTNVAKKTKSYMVQTVGESMYPWPKSRKGLEVVEDVTGEENIKKFLKKVGVLT